LGLLALVSVAPSMAADEVHLSIDASRPGPKINRNIFGQFAENLGHGLHEGIWVGPDSPIRTRAESATMSFPRSENSRCQTSAGRNFSETTIHSYTRIVEDFAVFF